jgi:hypothetical protein
MAMLDIPSTLCRIVIAHRAEEKGTQMSIYTQYAESLRDAHAEWAQAVESTTEGAKKYADQFRRAVVVDPEQAAEAFDFFNRALDTQADVCKKLSVASAELGVKVLTQLDALAEATRDFADGAQRVLNDQADWHVDEYVSGVERATQALTPSAKTDAAA